MRLTMILSILLAVAATPAFALDPICGAARQAECDPALAACLRDHPDEASIAKCIKKHKDCGERLRMPAARCVLVEGQIETAPGLGVAPEGSPVR